MNKQADRTRRSAASDASSHAFATVKPRGFSWNPPAAEPGPLAHRLSEIAVMAPAGAQAPATTGGSRLNNTGLPSDLESGIESLSGLSMNDVTVHYNSSQPARVNALAYTQGSDIYIAPGQERHLPHEAWHVVQQAQGRVKPTMRTNGGVAVNDDARLEYEADAMGVKVLAREGSMAGAGPEPASATERTFTRAQHGVIQRRNGALPENFRVTHATSNNTDCSVTTDLAWDSSNGSLADLGDFQLQEVVTFDANPVVNMPAYGNADLLRPGMRLDGNVLTKSAGVMSNPGGRDKHTGCGLGPKFTVGGIANLRRAEWTLIGTQYYQTKQDAGAWANAAGPFIITRTMRQVGDQFSLTISKVGPTCDVAAGPTPIKMETSTAMRAVGADRGDQTAEWNVARARLAGVAADKPALNFTEIATEVRNNPQRVAISVRYEYTSVADPAHLFAVAFDIPEDWRNTIFQQAQLAARGIIDNALTGPAPPTRFIITIFRCGGVQQQALRTNENDGTYRVLLRANKLMEMGQWGDHVDTSMPGRESKRGFSNPGKRERFTKATATHELGHMLHASSNRNKFLTATMMPADIPSIENAGVPDPLAAQKIHICQINGQVIAALNLRGYKQKWGYALNNPGEVVAEVFTAIQHRRNVPKGLAAVYVAYGGIRGGNIDAALQRIFDRAIPLINEPEDCIAIINE